MVLITRAHGSAAMPEGIGKVRRAMWGALLLAMATSSAVAETSTATAVASPSTVHVDVPRNTAQLPIIRRVESDVRREGVSGMLGVEAVFDVEAKPSEVLDVVWNVKRFQETFPDVQKLEVLERKSHELVLRAEVDAVLATVQYTMRRTFEPDAGRVRWVELGGDLERVRGSWEVTPLAEGRQSRVTYRSFVVVSTWIPETVYRELALRKIHEMIDRIRRAATHDVDPARGSAARESGG